MSFFAPFLSKEQHEKDKHYGQNDDNDEDADDGDGNYDDGSNILSVGYHPEKLMIYAAFDNGMMENWVPAACNQYVAIDLNVFIEQEEEN